MSQSSVENLVYLFDRPSLPIFRPRGEESSLNFDIPNNYFTDRFKSIAGEVQVRGPGTISIPVRELPAETLRNLQNELNLAMRLNKRANFSIFNDFHRQCATSLINIMLNMGSVDELLSACCYIQQRVNPFLYIYALSVAVIHRRDTRHLPLPSHVSTFPELYMDSTVIREARESGTVIQNAASRSAIEIPRDYTASDLDAEHRLAYFREDIGVNLHHWHWHLVYPLDGPLQIVQKDRRGELFYYMHHQILARYNLERFSNRLPRVTHLIDLREPLKEAYFPKMDSLIASRTWPSRQANVVLSDLIRETDQVSVDIHSLERWRDRIYEAIHRGFVWQNTEQLPLTESGGIDILGNMIESTILSVNRNLYGNLHNMGHNLISYCHDPDNRFLESFGVMGDSATAMRDPIFYRWHTFINEIFMEHKHTLPGYTVQQLSFDNVRVTGIEVTTQNTSNRNELQTFWQNSEMDLSRGVDFTPRGAILGRFTHLQHQPFTYRISVENGGAQRMGTVRIFIAPKFDERGVPFLFRHQKQLFVEMDKFVTSLRPGRNTIERLSTQSSVTIPFSQTFRNLEMGRPADNSASSEAFNFCGCGWPQHMLVPRGTPEGLLCELFVMITDYATDRVEGASTGSSGGCDDAVSFCGIRDSLYPDRKAMGFPFDRMPRAGVVTLRQFGTPNMAVQDIRIKFNDSILAVRRGNDISAAQGVVVNRIGGDPALSADPVTSTPTPTKNATPTPTKVANKPSTKKG